MSMVNAIDMSQCRDLDDFREKVESSTREGGTPFVLWNGRMIFTAVSPEYAKTLIMEKVADRLLSNPDALSELQRRLEDDSSDWDIDND